MDNLNPILDLLILDSFGRGFIPSAYFRYFQYTPIVILFFFITLLSTPIVGKLATRAGILNETGKEEKKRLNKFENSSRRINPNPVPLMGGLAVIVPILLAIPILLGFTPTTVPIILCVAILIAYGVIDDAFNMPATLQFAIQFFVSLVVVSFLVDLTIVKIPFDGFIELDYLTWQADFIGYELFLSFPGDFIAILWIMIAMNAVKWLNGLDALMETNMIIAYSMLFIIGVRTGILPVIVISSMLIGGISSFTVYNLPPAKIFSSATGSVTYGFLIATLSLVNNTKFASAIIILILPLVDFGFVLFKRFSIYKPKTLKELVLTPIQLMRMADTNHLHHQLLKLKLTPKQIVMAETIISLIAGSIAVSTTSAFRLLFVLIGGIIVATSILLIHLLTRKRELATKIEETEESPESKYSY